MRYSYEYKRKCVKLYRQGQWSETPFGVTDKAFRTTVRKWVRLEDSNRPEALKHKGCNKVWTPEEKLTLVMQVISGKSNKSVAFENGIHDGMLYQWVHKYKVLGYNGLINNKKGRPPKDPKMKKINYNNPIRLEESEYEELIRLRTENEYIKAEIEVIKKESSLREEKWAAQLKAKKQQSSKNYEKNALCQLHQHEYLDTILYLVGICFSRFQSQLPNTEPALLFHNLGYCGIIEHLHI